MTQERLAELQRRGWELTRDGSIATARLAWNDPEDPDSGWDLLILYTSGHAARFTLEPVGSGLTERTVADLERLRAALADAQVLLETWRGELPGEGSEITPERPQ